MLSLAGRRGGTGGMAMGEGRAAGALLLPAAALAGRRRPHAAGVEAVAGAAQRRAALPRLLTTLCNPATAIMDITAKGDDAFWLHSTSGAGAYSGMMSIQWRQCSKGAVHTTWSWPPSFTANHRAVSAPWAGMLHD